MTLSVQHGDDLAQGAALGVQGTDALDGRLLGGIRDELPAVDPLAQWHVPTRIAAPGAWRPVEAAFDLAPDAGGVTQRPVRRVPVDLSEGGEPG